MKISILTLLAAIAVIANAQNTPDMEEAAETAPDTTAPGMNTTSTTTNTISASTNTTSASTNPTTTAIKHQHNMSTGLMDDDAMDGSLSLDKPVAGAAPLCDVTKLMPLLKDPEVMKCANTTGLSIPPAEKVTDDILTKVCGFEPCKNAITKVKALNLGNCSMGEVRLQEDLLAPIDKKCNSKDGKSSSASMMTISIGAIASVVIVTFL